MHHCTYSVYTLPILTLHLICSRDGENLGFARRVSVTRSGKVRYLHCVNYLGRYLPNVRVRGCAGERACPFHHLVRTRMRLWTGDTHPPDRSMVAPSNNTLCRSPSSWLPTVRTAGDLLYLSGTAWTDGGLFVRCNAYSRWITGHVGDDCIDDPYSVQYKPSFPRGDHSSPGRDPPPFLPLPPNNSSSSSSSYSGA